MERMGWSWEDLLAVPYEQYLNIRRIINLEDKEEMKEKKRAERKAQRAK